MSEVIVPKSGVPGAMPSGILVRFASREFTSGGEPIKDLTNAWSGSSAPEILIREWIG